MEKDSSPLHPDDHQHVSLLQVKMIALTTLEKVVLNWLAEGRVNPRYLSRHSKRRRSSEFLHDSHRNFFPLNNKKFSFDLPQPSIGRLGSQCPLFRCPSPFNLTVSFQGDARIILICGMQWTRQHSSTRDFGAPSVPCSLDFSRGVAGAIPLAIPPLHDSRANVIFHTKSGHCRPALRDVRLRRSTGIAPIFAPNVSHPQTSL